LSSKTVTLNLKIAAGYAKFAIFKNRNVRRVFPRASNSQKDNAHTAQRKVGMVAVTRIERVTRGL
jgi:hypothetical protein